MKKLTVVMLGFALSSVVWGGGKSACARLDDKKVGKNERMLLEVQCAKEIEAAKAPTAPVVAPAQLPIGTPARNTSNATVVYADNTGRAITASKPGAELVLSLRKEDRKEHVAVEKAKRPAGCAWFAGCQVPVGYSAGYGAGYGGYGYAPGGVYPTSYGVAGSNYSFSSGR